MSSDQQYHLPQCLYLFKWRWASKHLFKNTGILRQQAWSLIRIAQTSFVCASTFIFFHLEKSAWNPGHFFWQGGIFQSIDHMHSVKLMSFAPNWYKGRFWGEWYQMLYKVFLEHTRKPSSHSALWCHYIDSKTYLLFLQSWINFLSGRTLSVPGALLNCWDFLNSAYFHPSVQTARVHVKRRYRQISWLTKNLC